MPDQELIDDFLEALEAAGSPVPNPVLRETLGWPETPIRGGEGGAGATRVQTCSVALNRE
jgi:hypothetical protein